MGLSVPDDVSIVGYDGIDFCQMLRPKLTTMRQDAERMGELAAEELARAVEEGRSYIPGRHVVGGTLLPGETVKKADTVISSGKRDILLCLSFQERHDKPL